MPLFAKPQGHSPWIYAVAKLAAFEEAHLVDDPDLGRIIRLNTPAEIQQYQELLDDETNAFNDKFNAPATTPLYLVP